MNLFDNENSSDGQNKGVKNAKYFGTKLLIFARDLS